GLFADTEAEDETQLSCDLADVAKRERLTAHRDSYITERDFAYLAHHGIGTVRIPVPFFIFGDYPPYVGCVEYLDRAFDWAETHQTRTLIDLHPVPTRRTASTTAACAVSASGIRTRRTS